MIKGLIFDLDGTLINSIGDIHHSLNLALKYHGYEEVSLEDAQKHTGRGFRKLIVDSLPVNTSEKIIDEVNKTYTKFYGEHYHERTYGYKGIYELLQELNKRNIKIAVNSNKKDEYTKNLMKIIFKDIEFTAVFGERIGIPTKPNPLTANQIISIMELDKNEVCYVGDSEVDIQTGKNANIKTIGCLWGFRTREILEKENPDIIVSKPEEILNYLGE